MRRLVIFFSHGILVCLAFACVTSAQILKPVPSHVPLTNVNQQYKYPDQAKKRALAFCAAWQAKALDSMYSMTAIDMQKALTKDKFDEIYRIKADRFIKLNTFFLRGIEQNESEVVAKIELSFAKQSLPTIVNGVHKFHMVQENEKWMVKVIVPPIPVPEEGKGSGGHPG